MASIEERLALLEQQMSLLSEGIVRAKRFEVVDEDGRVLAILGVTTEGEAGLGLADRQGKVRASFVINDKEPRLAFFDSRGKLRGMLGADSGGQPTLGFFDRKERSRLSLSTDKDGDPQIGFIRSDGEPCMTLTAEEDGSPGISLLTPEGEVGVAISHTNGNATLVLNGLNGANRIGMRVDSFGNATLTACDVSGIGRVTLAVTNDGTGALSTTHPGGLVRLMAYDTLAGMAGFMIGPGDGQPRIHAMVNDGGDPHFVMTNANGEQVFREPNSD